MGFTCEYFTKTGHITPFRNISAVMGFKPQNLSMVLLGGCENQAMAVFAQGPDEML